MAIRRLLDETRFPMRLVVNPTTGRDDDVFMQELVTVNGVAGVEQVTATLATLQGAYNRIPQTIRHPIFIELPLATLSAGVAGVVTSGPEALLNGHLIDFVNAKDLNPPNLTFDAAPGVYHIGQPTVFAATTPVTAASATSVTAGALALAVDAARGFIVEVVAGTGAGQKRRVIRNTATVLQLLSGWQATPDVTSTIRITRPGSIIDGAVIVSSIESVGGGIGVAFDPNCKLLANVAAAVGDALTVRNAIVGFMGEIEGVAEGSAVLAITQENNSQILAEYTNQRADPTGGNDRPSGMNFFNGTWQLTEHSNALSLVGGVVMTSARIVCTNQSEIQIRLDADGNRPILGTRTPGPGVDIDNTSVGILSPAVGTGFQLQGYTVAGARAQQNSKIDVTGMEIDDNDIGVLVLANSIGILIAATTAVNNTTFGATVRGNSTVRINRATTTLSGVTNEVFLGNATSGAARVWTDCNAGDAFRDGGGETAIGAAAPAAGIAEWGTMIDRAAP